MKTQKVTLKEGTPEQRIANQTLTFDGMTENSEIIYSDLGDPKMMELYQERLTENTNSVPTPADDWIISVKAARMVADALKNPHPPPAPVQTPTCPHCNDTRIKILSNTMACACPHCCH